MKITISYFESMQHAINFYQRKLSEGFEGPEFNTWL